MVRRVFLGMSVALAACGGDGPSVSPTTTAAATSPKPPTPVDRVDPNEILEGGENAFGLPIPRAMHVNARFPDAVRARGPLPLDALANYVRARVVAGSAETGPAKTVFPRATVKASPARMLRVEVISFGDITELVVRDVTRPSAKTSVTPTDPWTQPGFDPNDRKAEPKRFE